MGDADTCRGWYVERSCTVLFLGRPCLKPVAVAVLWDARVVLLHSSGGELVMNAIDCLRRRTPSSEALDSLRLQCFVWRWRHRDCGNCDGVFSVPRHHPELAWLLEQHDVLSPQLEDTVTAAVGATESPIVGKERKDESTGADVNTPQKAPEPAAASGGTAGSPSAATECPICLEKPVSAVYNPCGHSGMRSAFRLAVARRCVNSQG